MHRCCVTVDGHTVVDLWGGVARPAEATPWSRDTMAVVWSSTKGATALCAHMLASRGSLDIDAPVSRYRPEFAQYDKAGITVAHPLSHQAGLPAITKHPPNSADRDWQTMTRSLEEQRPLWPPGTRHGYHGLTFGWLVGEVVRRVTGSSLGAFFRDEVARPLGIDFWMGLPQELEARVARLIPPPPAGPGDPVSPGEVARADPGSVQALMFSNSGGYFDGEEYDSPRAHGAEVGGTGGITNARGLAGMYEGLACGGRLNGTSLRIEAMGSPVSKGKTAPRGSGSWNVLKSGYHAFSGLMWVTPRTPSLRLGIIVVIALAAGGVLLRFTSVEIALLILLGALLLAVETLNTAIEMLCDYIQPKQDPKIGKIKDVAAGATGITEIGAAIAIAILLVPHLWALFHP